MCFFNVYLHHCAAFRLVTMANADSARSGGQDSTVKVFDAITGETLHTLSGLETGTGSIAFSPTGRALAGGGWNGQLVVWDVSVSDPTAYLSN